MALESLKQLFSYSPPLNIVCGGSPEKHHLFLDYLTLNDTSNVSELHIDNHPDNTRPYGGIFFAYPCSTFMNDVLKKFNSVYWISCNNEYRLNDYNNVKTSFSNLGDLIKEVEEKTFDNLVIDVDPDILADYPTGYTRGTMNYKELKHMINHFLNTKNVKLLFFAAPKEFAEEIVHRKYKLKITEA